MQDNIRVLEHGVHTSSGFALPFLKKLNVLQVLYIKYMSSPATISLKIFFSVYVLTI